MAKILEQLLADEKPDVVARAQEQATEIVLEIHPVERERRERTQKNQGELAQSFGDHPRDGKTGT